MNYLLSLLYIIIIYLVFDFVKKNKSSKNKESDPPTPALALPVIGHLHLFAGSINPHRILTELAKKHGGIYSIYMGEVRTMVITDPNIMKEICCTQFETFANRPQPKSVRIFSGTKYSGLAFADYENTWQRNRKLVSAVFTKTKIKTFTDLIERQTCNLIESLTTDSKQGNTIGPKKYIDICTINIICSMIFSREVLKGESFQCGNMSRLTVSFQEAFKNVGKLDDYISILSPFFYFSNKHYKNQVREIYSFIEEIYDHHIAELDTANPKDLMDRLIIATDGKEKETVVLIGIDFLLAGSDTNAASISWFFLFMINNQEVQKKAYNELKSVIGKGKSFISLEQKDQCIYFNSLIKEILRVRSPGPLGIPRISREDTFVNGYFIPKDTQILLNIYGMGNLFVSEPNEIKPERWIDYNNGLKTTKTEDSEVYFDQLDKVSNPFSRGNRNCPGLNLSESVLFSVCSNLLLSFELTSIDNKQIDDVEVFGLSIHPKPFQVKLNKRNNN